MDAVQHVGCASGETAASALSDGGDASARPIPMDTAGANVVAMTAPPAEVGSLPDTTLVAPTAEEPGCKHCKGNHNKAHTCGKQRSRPTVEPKERSRRQRTETSTDALVVPSKSPSHPRAATTSATSCRSRALPLGRPLAQPPASSALPERTDDVMQRDHAPQPAGDTAAAQRSLAPRRLRRCPSRWRRAESQSLQHEAKRHAYLRDRTHPSFADLGGGSNRSLRCSVLASFVLLGCALRAIWRPDSESRWRYSLCIV